MSVHRILNGAPPAHTIRCQFRTAPNTLRRYSPLVWRELETAVRGDLQLIDALRDAGDLPVTRHARYAHDAFRLLYLLIWDELPPRESDRRAGRAA